MDKVIFFRLLWLKSTVTQNIPAFYIHFRHLPASVWPHLLNESDMAEVTRVGLHDGVLAWYVIYCIASFFRPIVPTMSVAPVVRYRLADFFTPLSATYTHFEESPVNARFRTEV